MPKDFCRDDYSPRKLRTTTLCGLVFATLSPDTPPIEEYLGAEVLGRLKRVLNRPIRVMGRFVQPLPNNWKLYVENVKDTYHASLLHTFFDDLPHHAPDPGRRRAGEPRRRQPCELHHRHARRRQRQRLPGAADPLRPGRQLRARPIRACSTSVDEFGDGIQLQILSVFPGFVLQQIHNAWPCARSCRAASARWTWYWTYFGFADDTPEMNRRRLKQQNLVGPAGFVSMEDGCVGGFVQRGIAAAGDEVSVVEMGGRRRREPGDARHRGLGARLLEGLSAVHGLLDDAGDGRRASRRSCNADYARAIDNEQLEEWPELLPRSLPLQDHHGGELPRGLEAGLIYADSRGMLEDRVSALRKANIYERQRYRHIVGLPVVLGQQRRRGRRRDAVPGGAHHARRRHGRVRHRLLPRQGQAGRVGRAALPERIVVCDSRRFDTLVAIPF